MFRGIDDGSSGTADYSIELGPLSSSKRHSTHRGEGSVGADRCRFCHPNEHSHAGIPVLTICECPDPYNKAHETCFAYHMFEHGRRTCKQCREPWRCDEEYFAHILARWKKVRLFNAVVFVVSSICSALVLLACLLTAAYLVKFIIYLLHDSGSVAFNAFGVPALAVRLEPSRGDLATGGTVVLALLAVRIGWRVVVRCRTGRCRFTGCCGDDGACCPGLDDDSTNGASRGRHPLLRAASPLHQQPKLTRQNLNTLMSSRSLSSSSSSSSSLHGSHIPMTSRIETHQKKLHPSVSLGRSSSSLSDHSDDDTPSVYD